MSATDELRRLLDERSVVHEDKHTELASGISGWDSTWWHGIAGMEFHAVGDETYGREDYVYVNGTYLTPEQAIAATLDSGKLTADDVRDLIEHNSYHVSGNTREFFNGAYEAIADELNDTPAHDGRL